MHNSKDMACASRRTDIEKSFGLRSCLTIGRVAFRLACHRNNIAKLRFRSASISLEVLFGVLGLAQEGAHCSAPPQRLWVVRHLPAVRVCALAFR